MFVHSSEVFPSCRHLVPPRAASPEPGTAQSRAESPAESWGGWVGVGAARSCAVTCSGLGGDSKTWGHQIAQRELSWVNLELSGEGEVQPQPQTMLCPC